MAPRKHLGEALPSEPPTPRSARPVRPTVSSGPTERLMSPKQMASVLDLAAVTLRRYVRDGRVPYRILPSGRIRFEPSKVLAALAVEVPAKKP